MLARVLCALIYSSMGCASQTIASHQYQTVSILFFCYKLGHRLKIRATYAYFFYEMQCHGVYVKLPFTLVSHCPEAIFVQMYLHSISRRRRLAHCQNDCPAACGRFNFNVFFHVLHFFLSLQKKG